MRDKPNATTLGDAYPKEQERLRKLLETYEEVRKLGAFVDFAVAGIKDVQRRADEAAISGDVVAMLRMYQEMKDCQ